MARRIRAVVSNTIIAANTTTTARARKIRISGVVPRTFGSGQGDACAWPVACRAGVSDALPLLRPAGRQRVRALTRRWRIRRLRGRLVLGLPDSTDRIPQ
jgi:hypothetical protein